MTHKRPFGSLVLATLLLLLGGVAMFVGLHDFPIRVVGLLAIVVSVRLIQRSRIPGRRAVIETPGAEDGRTAKGPGRALWTVSAVLALLLGASLIVLHLAAMSGGQEAWPVVLFAGVALACTLVWSYLVFKISLARRGRK